MRASAEGLLGALLLNNEVLDRIGFLAPEHFYEPVHGRIFTQARDWIQAGKLASPVTMKTVLAEDEGLQELGGTDYLARLAGATISVLAAPDYAETVMELYSRREVITAAESAIAIAGGFTEDGGASQAIEHLDGDLDAIRGNTQRRAPSVSFATATTSAMERMVEARNHGAGTPTGIASLDRQIGGLYPGDLLYIAGRPSMGKTALAVSMARRIATRGRTVIFSSLEMQSEDLGIRMASEALRECGHTIAYRDVRQGRVDDYQAETFMRASLDIEHLPIEIIESHVRRLAHLQSEIRRLVRRARTKGQEIGAIFIDYLGLIELNVPNDNSWVSQISAALKGMAGEHKVPLVVLAQLNRQVENRDDKRPRLADLRDSGSIEQDADTVIFCYREEYYEERTEPKERAQPNEDDIKKHAAWEIKMDRCRGKLDLIVAKQRMGPVGTVTLECDLATNSIWDTAP
ncbi:MAG: DnaB-like helicase C-terminal domain-containing protein [Limibaculum sp.]